MVHRSVERPVPKHIAASSAQCQTYPTCLEGALGKSFQHRAHLLPRTKPARSAAMIRTAQLRPKR
eukprot:11879991-Heterocapsa_arctica.AAC.1